MSSVPAVPVTPLGLAAGPGVTDTTVTLGLITEPGDDRGFMAGVELWTWVANNSGGVCGRTVQILQASEYAQVATRSAGLILDLDDPTGAGRQAAADEIVALTDSAPGVAAGSGIIPVGATDDILVFNTLDWLAAQGALTSGDVLGVLSDGSPSAAAALSAARTWAAAHQVLVLERPTAPAGWGATPVVLAWHSPESVAAVLSTSPDALVVTDARGFDPDGTDPAAASRLRVALTTPALGGPRPAAQAVGEYAALRPDLDFGPRSVAGYAVGGQWARLLRSACDALDLSRPGLVDALVAVGPSPPEALLGSTNPVLPATGAAAATTSSSITVPDPANPDGLAVLAWISDPDLSAYTG